MKLRSAASVILVVLHLFFCSCKKEVQGPAGPAGPAGAGFKHYIGEKFGGGIVFHVDRDSSGNEHGLILSLADLGAPSAWGLSGTDVQNCESSWNGAANTASILKAGGLATEAAGLCNAYRGAGQTDWYLPALHQVNLMIDNQYDLNRVLDTDGDPATTVLSFGPSSYYWTSTEADATYATAFQFLGAISTKTSLFPVRAVRDF
jgi:hypothetical protein